MGPFNRFHLIKSTADLLFMSSGDMIKGKLLLVALDQDLLCCCVFSKKHGADGVLCPEGNFHYREELLRKTSA